MIEKILGDSSNTRRKSVFKTKNSRRDSGFKLGSVKDLNISGIEKNEEEDPNQLFSLREGIAETTPERDSNANASNSRSPDQSKQKTS